ncbi:DsbA family protein [Lichenibacterium dinghuense]|uniref:DsbA family protein n=1 Tax=Lichenibacterium dinghuense TaxID=2895977 RepID=UPI003D176E6A
MHRRSFNWAMAACALAIVAAPLLRATPAWSDGIDVNEVLHDPDAPVAGNPKGDVTVVAFLDYNCPFCKHAAPDLAKLVATDHGVRLVYKDWPILTPASTYGARMALASKYQGKYDAVHAALMAIPGRRIPEEQMRAAIAASGVDMDRLEADAKAHATDIDALLKRNLAEADALGLEGTPVFLIGPFKVAQALDYDGFKDAVAKARARAKTGG